MKVRYSVFAAALAAGVTFAAPAFAVEDEKDDAANDAKWLCVIDKICDGSGAVVGEGLEGEEIRPLIDDARPAGRAKTPVAASAPKVSAAPARQQLAATGARVRQVPAGRPRTIDTGAVSVPKGVAEDNDLVVTFRRNSAELESGITKDMQSLARVVLNSIAAGNNRVIQIGGYTDATGDDAFNMKLSQDRAEAVRKSLMDLGVPGNAIQAMGYGESKLVEGFAPTHGINRRVEVVVVN